MITRLVILGFLKRRPLYGYEIKQWIEHIMGDWANIAFGSIYFALGKLTKDGFIRKKETTQEGNRPSRNIYQITETGKREFLKLLRKLWGTLENQYFSIDIGLQFMDSLPVEEITGFLQNRVKHLEHILIFLEKHQEEELSDDHVPVNLVSAIFSHHRLHYKAELDWTKTLLKKIEQGVFDKELDWMKQLKESGE